MAKLQPDYIDVSDKLDVALRKCCYVKFTFVGGTPSFL